MKITYKSTINNMSMRNNNPKLQFAIMIAVFALCMYGLNYMSDHLAEFLT